MREGGEWPGVSSKELRKIQQQAADKVLDNQKVREERLAEIQREDEIGHREATMPSGMSKSELGRSARAKK